MEGGSPSYRAWKPTVLPGEGIEVHLCSHIVDAQRAYDVHIRVGALDGVKVTNSPYLRRRHVEAVGSLGSLSCHHVVARHARA